MPSFSNVETQVSSDSCGSCDSSKRSENSDSSGTNFVIIFFCGEQKVLLDNLVMNLILMQKTF